MSRLYIDSFGDGAWADKNAWAIGITNGGEIQIVGNGANIGATSTLEYLDGAWHYVCWVRQGTTNMLYGDAVNLVNITNSNDFNNVGIIKINGNGADGGTTTNLKGMVDDLIIYNSTALSSSNITYMYNSGNGYEADLGSIPENPAPASMNLSFPANNSYGITNYFNVSISGGINVTNTTFFIWNSSGFKQTFANVSNSSNITIPSVNLSIGFNKWSANLCGVYTNTSVFCIDAGVNWTYYYGFTNVSESHTSPVYETDAGYFSFVVNSTASPTASIYYNGTKYAATISSLGAGLFNATYNLIIPSGAGTKNIQWEITNGGLSNNYTGYTQVVNNLIWGLCNSTNGDKYMNITFKNETASQERVPASIISTWTYYINSSAYAKTATFNNLTANTEYNFCFNGANKTAYVSPSVNYYNADSLARNYIPGYLTISALRHVVLYLLPTGTGSYVSFQIVNSGEQILTGVTVNVTHATYGLIESKDTDGSGIVTFFLNPTEPYTVCAVETGYTTVCELITPTQSTYTINMGGSTSGNQTNNFNKGITYKIRPELDMLVNGTEYNFNFTINSTFWALDEFGFTILNSTGGVMGSANSSGSSGGIASKSLNISINSSKIYGYFFWRVGQNYTNVTRTWIVYNPDDSQFSFWKVFDRFSYYVGNETADSDGIFGLVKKEGNNFGLYLIVFLVIFFTTGVLSWKFGLNSPAAILLVAWSLVFFFDVALKLLPRLDTFPNLPVVTGLFFLVLVGVFLRENYG